MSVRATSPLIAGILVAGCHPHNQSQPTWESGDRPYRVVYRFADRSESYFAGQCFGAPQGPVFGLMRGDYPDASDFILQVDSRKWTLATFRGVHGGALIIEDPEVIAAIADAKVAITISVGTQWKRQVPADARLAAFFNGCLALPGWEKKPWPEGMPEWTRKGP